MADALNVKMDMFFDDPDDMGSWEMEIEAIIVLLKSKRGRSVRKIYKLDEVLGECFTKYFEESRFAIINH